MLEIQNLTKYFKKGGKTITALENVSFKIKEKEIVGLLGPNGSGKSTLINLIIGFYLPDKGDIQIFGESIYKNKDLVKKYVRFPFLIEDPRFTVYEVLKLTAKFFRVENWKEEIEYWMKFFDLEKERNTQIQKLSTGNYQKVKIIGALISDPKILLLDEITNGLDLLTVNKLLDTLKMVNKEHGVSILFASHIFQHIEKLCSRVIILYKGKILADDAIDKLKTEASLKEYITIRTKEPLPIEIFEKIREEYQIIQVSETSYKIVTDDASKELKNFSKTLASNQLINQYIEDISIEEVSLEDVFAYLVEKGK